MEKTIKTKYFEFTPGWSEPSLVYHVAGYHEPKPMLQIYPFWGKFFIYLPWYHYKKIKTNKTLKEKRFDKMKKLSNPKYKPKIKYKKQLYYDCDSPSYGFYYHMKQIGINYGNKVKLIDTPWAYDWVRTSQLMKDGSWEHETKGNIKEFYDDKIWGNKKFEKSYPYKYIKKDGTIQETIATITVSEKEWRLKYFKWFKYIKKIDRTVDVNFKDEIGESTGSYKGGVLGVGYNMIKGETPYQTLKRMEKERKFN